jgi:hypothetical protein
MEQLPRHFEIDSCLVAVFMAMLFSFPVNRPHEYATESDVDGIDHILIK